MAKQSALEKAIEQLDSEIAVLQAAKARLVQQQGKAPKRPRPVAVEKVSDRPA